MAETPKDRKRLPREFPAIDPEADLEPDAPRPGPSGEKAGRLRKAPRAADPAQEREPSAPEASPSGGPGRTAPRGTDAPAFALPDMPRTVSLVTDSVITRPLAERMTSARHDPIGVVIELRTDAGLPTDEVVAALLDLVNDVVGETDPAEESAWQVGNYVVAEMTAAQILELVNRDSRKGSAWSLGASSRRPHREP